MKSNNRIKFLEYKVALLGATLCLIVLALTGPALAGPEQWSGKDKNVAVAPEEPFSWTGFYIGGNFGGNWADFDFGHHFTDIQAGAIEDISENNIPSDDDFTLNDEDVATLFTWGAPSQSDASLFGGAQVGYNHQFGHIVVGVEADFDGSSARSDAPGIKSSVVHFLDDDSDYVAAVLDSQRSAEVNWTASVRGRLGYANGRLLLYVTGGVAWADVTTWQRDVLTSHVFDFNGNLFTVNEEENSPVTNASIHHDNGTLCGWTGGAGADYAFSKAVTLGVEYRHNDFGDDSFHYGSSGDGIIHTSDTRVGLSTDQVTMRVNILLGHLGLPK